ncbi:MAG: hypothetical protein WEC84_00565 [Candidatus Andersenbacteria bacterium]
MRTTGRKYLFLGIGIVFLSLMHVILQDYLASYLVAPVTISLFMAFTIAPAPVVVLLVVLAELFSFLPPGVATAVVLLPFGSHRVFSKVEPRLSGSFLAVVSLTVALQLLLIGVAPLIPMWQTMDMWRQIWHSLPITPFLLSASTTTIVMYMGIILWYEVFPPQQDAANPHTFRS